MSALLLSLGRELRIAARHKSEWVLPPLFFAMIAVLFALGSKPGAPLLAALLTLDRLFRGDLEEGWLEQILVGPSPAYQYVLGKLLAHWVLSGLPLVLLSAPLCLLLGMEAGAGLRALLLGLLLGTPILSLVGGFAAALTVGLPRAGLLLPVLVLPILAPVVIFGSGAVRAAQAGLDAAGPIYFLAALLALALTLLPWACSVALRNAFD